MKTRLLATAALGAALGVSMPAEAEGLYVGAFGGVSILEDSDLTVDNAGLSYDVEVDSDTGWALGGALGYAFDFGLRTEAELAYRRNDLDKFHVTNPLPSTVSVDGDTTALSILGNVWYDIPVSFALRPYVGAGIGMASVGVNDAESAVADVIDDSDWVLAYQLGAGLAYALSAGWDVTAEYRYFRTEDATLGLEGLPGDAEYEYRDHSVVLGVRYSFQ
jgi:opacity protein-like surface antigen